MSFVPYNVKNIDWQGKRLTIYGKNTTGSGGKKRRVVPFTNRTKIVLEAHFALNEEIGLTKRTAERIVKRVANRARICKPCCPHVLRHTFVVESLNNGIPLPALSKVLGHEDLRTTMIYLNLSNSEAVRLYHEKWER